MGTGMGTFSVYREWDRIKSNASTVHPLKMIPQIMCAPGSTAAVEGIFSVAGYILSPRRMSFTDENFENQLFANLNRGIFEVSSNKLKLC